MTHKNFNIMDRKTLFRKTAGTLLLAVLAYALLSCSSSSDDSGSNNPPTGGNPDCLANGTNSSIFNNHGHSLTVSKADVIAGVRKLYNFTGSSSHSHMWVCTEDMFTILKGNAQVSNATGTTENHRHPVTISCAVD